MFAKLLNALAWEDPQLLPLADYWRLAGMHGPGRGGQRIWKMEETYSGEVASRLMAGDVIGGDSRSEWSVAFL
jgi:hypothetical protein